MQTIRTVPRRAAAALVALVLLTGVMPACESATAPPEVVALRGTPHTVAIRNRTDAPIFTFVVGRRASALVDWFPCVNGVGCQPIGPGRTEVRPVSTGVDMPAEQEVLVYWWHAVGRPDGTVGHDSVRYVVVKLK